MTEQFAGLTLEVYRFIRDFLREHHYSPTLREIGDGCYASHTTIITHLARLEAKGWIVREIGIARSITLGERAPDYDADFHFHHTR